MNTSSWTEEEKKIIWMMQASKVSMKNSAEIFEHCASVGGGVVKKNKLASYGEFQIGNPWARHPFPPQFKNSHHHHQLGAGCVCVCVCV